MPLTRFENGQRVRVADAEHELAGRSGTVARLRHADVGAWVTMDDDLPDHVRVFPVEDDRARNTLLFPDECEAL